MIPSMNRRRGWILLAGGVVSILATGCWWLNFRHCHCIKAVSVALLSYAEEHEGKFPSSPKGFGDALLLLAESFIEDPMPLVEPGDDGHVYSDALASGGDVDERLCTRIYVQGLDDKIPSGVALLFDRDGCPGGDHFRMLWGRPVREVTFVGGGMDTVPDAKWPEFARRQILLLVQTGMPLETARGYYLMTGLTAEQLEDSK